MKFTDILPDIPPVKRLVTLSVKETAASVDGWVWMRALQGLVNRAEPRLYLIQDEYTTREQPEPLHENHWLDYYRERFGLPVETIADRDELIENYKQHVDGYILYDNVNVLQTQNLAITRCGLESLLPIAPDQEGWMTRHGIPKRDDLRDCFATNVEAARWAISNLWPKCNRSLYANLCIHRPFWYALDHTLVDFIVYHRGLALDLPLSRQTRETLYLYREMLEAADPPGIQMNWHCILDQEKEYIAEAAQRGFFSLCSVASPNMTIHGGVGDTEAAYQQPLPAPETCVAEKGKTYVCLYISDGDATWAQNNLHSDNWASTKRGSFKLGWGLLPLMTQLQPAMLKYYHETRTPNDCFWGPSSGVGYTYSHLWPDGLVGDYLRETRRLLDQSGQHGCNMVNWFLRDWWREVEDDTAIRREQEVLKDGPGLVCGLGGSPYAQSYLGGPIPKLHSVHIANVGRDNIGDIVKFTMECPTRPLFMFLFAQIAPGALNHMADEMAGFKQHPDIVLLSMDEFFLTLQDALKRGLVKDTLYEKTDALAETWLKAPGRHRLPYCVEVSRELADVAQAEPAERRRRLAQTAWIDLVSAEIENVARDRDLFLTRYAKRPPVTPVEEADTLLYAAFTVAWTCVRSAIEAQGIYANHRTQCLKDFKRTCGQLVATASFEGLFDAWEHWETNPPEVDMLVPWCTAVADATQVLRDQLGPSAGESFDAWPPRTI